MTSNPNYKPSEGKREEFRKYLEKNGIMDALTKVLVNLYEEVDKPENALQYILDKLSIQAGHDTHEVLESKLNEAQARIKDLENQIDMGVGRERAEEPDEGVQEGAAVDDNPNPEQSEV